MRIIDLWVRAVRAATELTKHMSQELAINFSLGEWVALSEPVLQCYYVAVAASKRLIL
jgi:hypothetical protein